jgi:hypothetical protein
MTKIELFNHVTEYDMLRMNAFVPLMINYGLTGGKRIQVPTKETEQY